MTDTKPGERPQRPKRANRPNTAIATGIHSAMRVPLASIDGLTHGERPRCGGCTHLEVAYEGRTVTDHTCNLIDLFVAVEPEWPGCFKHEPRKS